ncbi:TauD/TfdA dioxygenase family protein [Haliea sp. E17]|uniref:TauD/TfdA dioxygenase family protein n=1 Tax=Haliea sp. E17 TaxID=3401576 RepID=UPI003AAA5A3B
MNILAQLDGVELVPLKPDLPFGAEVRGLNREHLEDQAVRSAVNALLVQAGVIYFRGEDTHEMQLEISKCIGELEHFPYPETWVENHPELVEIKYFPDNGTCYEVDGECLGGWVPWHTDLIYTDAINRGGVLRPKQLSQHGGKTGFLDQILAYERLPEELRHRIADLHVVYSPDINLANSRFAGFRQVRFIRGARSFNEIIKRVYQRPLVLHPLVYVQKESGRKVLNFSPGFAQGIYELGGPEGEALLTEVASYCASEDYAYYHAWQPGDMVLWDNWRVLHCATGIPVDEERVMYRTTISGDYKLGRRLRWETGELEKIEI